MEYVFVRSRTAGRSRRSATAAATTHHNQSREHRCQAAFEVQEALDGSRCEMSREERVYNVGRKLKFTLTEDHLIEDGSRGVSHWRQAWPLQQLSPEVESQTGRPQGSVVGLIVMGRGLKTLRVETWTTIRKWDGTAATSFSHRRHCQVADGAVASITRERRSPRTPCRASLSFSSPRSLAGQASVSLCVSAFSMIMVAR